MEPLADDGALLGPEDPKVRGLIERLDLGESLLRLSQLSLCLAALAEQPDSEVVPTLPLGYG